MSDLGLHMSLEGPLGAIGRRLWSYTSVLRGFVLPEKDWEIRMRFGA